MTKQSIEVEGFNRRGQYAVLTDGQAIPITTWFDEFGDEVGAFDRPISAVAGPDNLGKFWSIDLLEFEPVVTH